MGDMVGVVDIDKGPPLKTEGAGETGDVTGARALESTVPLPPQTEEEGERHDDEERAALTLP